MTNGRKCRRFGIPREYAENVINVDINKLDAVIQMPDGTWIAFEVKFTPADVDAAAGNLVRVAAKFKRNPPKSQVVIVGKSGIAYRREEDGVYVLPLTSLKA